MSSIIVANLGDALARVTEVAAVAASKYVGRGDEQAADLAAAKAMKAGLAGLSIDGKIVVGESEILDDYEQILAPGEEIGQKGGPEFDIALDALEGATITAKAKSNALTILAAGPRGCFMPAPDIYMDKIAIGPGHTPDIIDLDAPAGENALAVAKSKGVDISQIRACVLDRPRHREIVDDLRRVGAGVYLIGDGDVAAVINTSAPRSGIDMYVGQGGACEGVLAAAALKCVGGQMQGRLVFRSGADRASAERAGVEDLNKRYGVDDMVTGEVDFAASAVTRGSLLDGVSTELGRLHTHSLIMSSATGAIRRTRSNLPLNTFDEVLGGQ